MHAVAGKTHRTSVLFLPALGGLTVLVSVGALLLGSVVAPPDAIQGQAQRWMYIHVPAAWTAYCAFGTVLVCSVAVLLGRGRRWDQGARAAAEIGVGMTALAIAVGSIWGHSVWGVWWTWDPRLVSTALLLLVYVACLATRGLTAEPARSARRAAVIGVVGFGQVLVAHFSVLWWRSLHQPPTLLAPSASPPIDHTMLVALLTSVLAFMSGAGWLFLHRLSALQHGRIPPVSEGSPAHDPVRVRVGAGAE